MAQLSDQVCVCRGMRGKLWVGLVGTCMLLLVSGAAGAQAPRSVAEQYLFQAANAERRQLGLEPLRWDGALYRAAALHARQMAARESIAHQYAGEAELSERARTAGVRFTEVAENVAEAPTAVMIHRGWMQSEHHRDNLLDPRLDRVAICVLVRNGQLYAVEDFDRGFEAISFAEQESMVASLLSEAAPINVGVASAAARATCELETGYAGSRRPWFVMRFTASSLRALPIELRNRLMTGRYHQAEVGACAARGVGPFAAYNIAVLFYP